jgi:hypothetical protein
MAKSPSVERVKESSTTPTRIYRRLSQLELAVEHTLLNRADIEEAMLLQRSFYGAKHWEYAGLFATLLMDVDMLLKLFKDELLPFDVWKNALTRTESRGYEILISRIQSLL